MIAATIDLFYRRGFRAVAVSEIAAQAGVTKTTLYRHFASKDELATTCLERVTRADFETYEAIARRHPSDALGQLRAIVAAATRELGAARCRGWFLTTVAVEVTDPTHPVRLVVDAHKRRTRDHLAELAKLAGAPRAGTMADSLLMILAGAAIARQISPDEDPANLLVAAFEELLLAQGLSER